MKLLADEHSIPLNHPSLRMNNYSTCKKPSVPGKIVTCSLAQYPNAQYHLYVPKKGGWGAPILVAVHGISHRAKEKARAFRDMAERYGIVVLAPLFSRQSFPAYQRLGVTQKKVPLFPDQILNVIIDEVGLKTGARTERVYLFGYSAGGQFVHRYAMLHPEKVHAVAMGAPGWYTSPEPKAPFPLGLHIKPGMRQLRLEPKKFLRIPMAVFVGEHDDQRDESLKQSSRIDAQQGLTRIERAQRWTDTMRATAKSYGYNTTYEYKILKNCGHSFDDCVKQGELAQNVFNFLFSQYRHSWASDQYGLNDELSYQLL